MEKHASLLFVDQDRQYDGPIEYGETLYHYYARSSSEHAKEVRDKINSWLPALPGKLIENMLKIPHRSQNNTYEHDNQFVSVIYEAYIYRLLLSLGVKREHIEYEKLAINGRYPEFFVDHGSDSFYVEATLAGEVSSQEKLLSEIIDKINKNIPVYKYNLRLTIFNISAPGDNFNCIPKQKNIIKEISNWLDQLDMDLVISEQNKYIDDVTHRKVINYRGIGLIFKAIPHDDAFTRTIISINTYMAGSKETDLIIRNKIDNKHVQLKSLNFPCILAINTTYDFSAGEWDLTKALLGDPVIMFYKDPAHGPATSVRFPNGCFGPNDSQYSFLSGVLLSPGFSLHNIDRVKMEFLINPWATNLLKDNNPFLKLKRISVDPETGATINHHGLDASETIKNHGLKSK